MTNALDRSPADRDRAVHRLRTLTIGSAVGGLAAVAAFGAVAAASYDGTPSTNALTAAVTTDGSSSSTTGSSSSTSDTATSAGTTSTATATTTPTVTATAGSAHATSGGS